MNTTGPTTPTAAQYSLRQVLAVSVAVLGAMAVGMVALTYPQAAATTVLGGLTVLVAPRLHSRLVALRGRFGRARSPDASGDDDRSYATTPR